MATAQEYALELTASTAGIEKSLSKVEKEMISSMGKVSKAQEKHAKKIDNIRKKTYEEEAKQLKKSFDHLEKTLKDELQATKGNAEAQFKAKQKYLDEYDKLVKKSAALQGKMVKSLGAPKTGGFESVLGKLSTGFKGIPPQAMAAGAAIAGAGVAAYKAAKNFDNYQASLNKLQYASGMTAEETQKLGNALRQIERPADVSAEAVTDIATTISTFAKSEKEIVGLTEGIVNLQKTYPDANPVEVTAGLQRLTAQLGDSGKAMDYLASTAKMLKGKSNDPLGESATELSTVFSKASVAIRDTDKAMTAAQQVFNAFLGAGLEVGEATSTAEAVFEDLKNSLADTTIFEKLQSSMEGTGKSLADVGLELGNIDPTKLIQFLQQSPETGAKLSTELGTVGERIDILVSSLNKSGKSMEDFSVNVSGAAQAVEDLRTPMQQVTDQIAQQWDNLWYNLGASTQGGVTAITQFAADALEGIAEWFEPADVSFQKAIDKAQAWVNIADSLQTVTTLDQATQAMEAMRKVSEFDAQQIQLILDNPAMGTEEKLSKINNQLDILSESAGYLAQAEAIKASQAASEELGDALWGAFNQGFLQADNFLTRLDFTAAYDNNIEKAEELKNKIAEIDEQRKEGNISDEENRRLLEERRNLTIELGSVEQTNQGIREKTNKAIQGTIEALRLQNNGSLEGITYQQIVNDLQANFGDALTNSSTIMAQIKDQTLSILGDSKALNVEQELRNINDIESIEAKRQEAIEMMNTLNAMRDGVGIASELLGIDETLLDKQYEIQQSVLEQLTAKEQQLQVSEDIVNASMEEYSVANEIQDVSKLTATQQTAALNITKAKLEAEKAEIKAQITKYETILQSESKFIEYKNKSIQAQNELNAAMGLTERGEEISVGKAEAELTQLKAKYAEIDKSISAIDKKLIDTTKAAKVELEIETKKRKDLLKQAEKQQKEKERKDKKLAAEERKRQKKIEQNQKKWQRKRQKEEKDRKRKEEKDRKENDKIRIKQLKKEEAEQLKARKALEKRIEAEKKAREELQRSAEEWANMLKKAQQVNIDYLQSALDKYLTASERAGLEYSDLVDRQQDVSNDIKKLIDSLPENTKLVKNLIDTRMHPELSREYVDLKASAKQILTDFGITEGEAIPAKKQQAVIDSLNNLFYGITQYSEMTKEYASVEEARNETFKSLSDRIEKYFPAVIEAYTKKTGKTELTEEDYIKMGQAVLKKFYSVLEFPELQKQQVNIRENIQALQVLMQDKEYGIFAGAMKDASEIQEQLTIVKQTQEELNKLSYTDLSVLTQRISKLKLINESLTNRYNIQSEINNSEDPKEIAQLKEKLFLADVEYQQVLKKFNMTEQDVEMLKNYVEVGGKYLSEQKDLSEEAMNINKMIPRLVEDVNQNYAIMNKSTHSQLNLLKLISEQETLIEKQTEKQFEDSLKTNKTKQDEYDILLSQWRLEQAQVKNLERQKDMYIELFDANKKALINAKIAYDKQLITYEKFNIILENSIESEDELLRIIEQEDNAKKQLLTTENKLTEAQKERTEVLKSDRSALMAAAEQLSEFTPDFGKATDDLAEYFAAGEDGISEFSQSLEKLKSKDPGLALEGIMEMANGLESAGELAVGASEKISGMVASIQADDKKAVAESMADIMKQVGLALLKSSVPPIRIAGAILLLGGVITGLIAKVMGTEKTAADIAEERAADERLVYENYKAQIDAMQKLVSLGNKQVDSLKEQLEYIEKIRLATIEQSHESSNIRKYANMTNEELAAELAKQEQIGNQYERQIERAQGFENASRGARRDFLKMQGYEMKRTQDSTKSLQNYINQQQAALTLSESNVEAIENELEYREQILDLQKDLVDSIKNELDLRISISLELNNSQQAYDYIYDQMQNLRQRVVDIVAPAVSTEYAGEIRKVLADTEDYYGLLRLIQTLDMSVLSEEDKELFDEYLQAFQEFGDILYEHDKTLEEKRQQLFEAEMDRRIALAKYEGASAEELADLEKERQEGRIKNAEAMLELINTEIDRLIKLGASSEDLLDLFIQRSDIEKEILDLMNEEGKETDVQSAKLAKLVRERQKLLEMQRQGQVSSEEVIKKTTAIANELEAQGWSPAEIEQFLQTLPDYVAGTYIPTGATTTTKTVTGDTSNKVQEQTNFIMTKLNDTMQSLVDMLKMQKDKIVGAFQGDTFKQLTGNIVNRSYASNLSVSMSQANTFNGNIGDMGKAVNQFTEKYLVDTINKNINARKINIYEGGRV